MHLRRAAIRFAHALVMIKSSRFATENVLESDWAINGRDIENKDLSMPTFILSALFCSIQIKTGLLLN